MRDSELIRCERDEARAAERGDDPSYYPRIGGRRVFYGDVPDLEDVD